MKLISLINKSTLLNKVKLAVLPLMMLAACSESSNEAALNNAESQNIESSVQNTSQVLATVNGQDITQADVNFMIERTFSNVNQRNFDDALRSKVLQSLIASKAMKQVMQAEMDQQQLTEVQQKINAYGEELFVKEYLVKNASPEPVSTQMVQDYYESHLDEFGGGQTKTIELLKTANEPSEDQRDKILDSVQRIKQSADWSRFSNTNSELGLSYFQSKMQPGLFDPQLERATKLLSENDVSEVIMLNSVPHIIKVVTIETLAAKPIAAVSAEIRKKLAALQLKKAVKKASDVVISEATVELK